MKKRAAALLCCLVLLVQMAVPPAGAAQQVYFTAINANILPLTEESMPFWANRYLYVDSGMFSMMKNTPGRQLGIYRSLNAAKGLLVLSAEGRSLIFDLEAQTVEDNQGVLYSPGAVRRNGRVFVPVSLVSYFFGFEYSSTRVDQKEGYHGYLIRLKNDQTAIPDDEVFADAAAHLMVNRYAEYRKSQAGGGSFENRPDEHEGAQKGKTVYLCFRAEDPGQTESILDILDVSGARGTFYCSQVFLEEQGNLLRRMTATGHAVGILAEAGDEKHPTLEALEQGNRALERATCGRTRFARIDGITEQEKLRSEAGGYCCLREDLNREKYPLESGSAAATLLKRVEQRRGGVSVWLSGGTTAAGLKAFLSSAKEAGHRCAAMSELA